MFALKNIAAPVGRTGLKAIFSLFAIAVASTWLAGCSALPSQPVRPATYDFGPAALASAPQDAVLKPLPAIALADVQSTGQPEGSTAVAYRLAYADAQQLRPYTQARWIQPPAQLVQQQVREILGQRRAVLSAAEGAAQAREGGRLPLVLRLDLEEFSQVFTSPTHSAGVLRLRASLLDTSPQGERLWGQRVFVVQQPAKSADAVGGVRALADAAKQAAQDIAQWLQALEAARGAAPAK